MPQQQSSTHTETGSDTHKLHAGGVLVTHFRLTAETTPGASVRLYGEADVVEHDRLPVAAAGRQPGGIIVPSQEPPPEWLARLRRDRPQDAVLLGDMLYRRLAGVRVHPDVSDSGAADRRESALLESAILDLVEESGGDRAAGIDALTWEYRCRVVASAVDHVFDIGHRVSAPLGARGVGCTILAVARRLVTIQAMPFSYEPTYRRDLTLSAFVRAHRDPGTVAYMARLTLHPEEEDD